MACASSRALDDLRALVLSDHTLHLQQQAVLRTLTDGSFDEVDLNTAFGQFFDQDLLMHVVARQTIGTVDQDYVQQAVSRGVAKSIKCRAIEPRAGESVVDVAVMLGNSELQLAGGALQYRNLRSYRLLLLLMRGGDARIKRRSSHHGLPAPLRPSLSPRRPSARR